VRVFLNAARNRIGLILVVAGLGVGWWLSASACDRVDRIHTGHLTATELGTALASFGAGLRDDFALRGVGLVAFEGRLELALAAGTAGPLVLRLTGHHRLAADTGSATFELLPLELALGGSELQEWIPMSGGAAISARGTLEAQGNVGWEPGVAPEGGVDVALRDVDVVTEAASIERLNGVVRIEPFWPPQSPPHQEVAMARVDLGIELREGAVSFQLRPGGVLHIESASWRVMGGRVATAGELDLTAEKRSLVLAVDDLSLGQLFELATLEGLSGAGLVDGVLPITLSAAGPEVRGGRIAARRGGWIRYAPESGIAHLAETTPGFEVLLPALRNFHFEVLAMELNGELRGNVTLGLQLEGANPDYMDGHPVRLNLNIDAHLADLLKAGEWVYEIPERIEAELRNFRNGAPAGAQK